MTKHCSIPQPGRWSSQTGTLVASYSSVCLDAVLELNTTQVLSGCAMNYRLVESEKGKPDGWYWDNSMRKTMQFIISIKMLIVLSGRHFSLFASSLSYSLCISPSPLLTLSQGNQWEPVTLSEQRHYSGDSVWPIKQKKPTKNRDCSANWVR